ncbi:LAME_0A02003g1_1 [Lachancea meyersii CBS 8951]|uniref:LAME_0A02003g1_1 n=1 Tax=Lachancea meyersii CBS 8951 TaxID=1266667 RepID=A0A1G4IMA7_9SACH|nr:LAME_0A02003g1_1 [Lachancea meyersii CBS 8951]
MQDLEIYVSLLAVIMVVYMRAHKATIRRYRAQVPLL